MVPADPAPGGRAAAARVAPVVGMAARVVLEAPVAADQAVAVVLAAALEAAQAVPAGAMDRAVAAAVTAQARPSGAGPSRT